MTSVTSSMLISIVTALFTDTGLYNVSMTLEQLPAGGGGYVGTLVRSLVSGIREDTTYSFDTVIKTGPNKAEARKYLSITRMMDREVLFYKYIAPEYQKIQTELISKGVLDFPKYYVSSNKYLEEVLVIENLRKRGYASASLLDSTHASEAVRALAKFHALSFLFQSKQPDLFHNISQQLTDCLFESVNEYDATGVHKYAGEVFDKFVGAIKNEDYKLRLLNKRMNFSENLQRLYGSGGIRVISHGDYWINNIMFKYQNSTPQEAVILDYQMLRYSSLVNDLLSFIGTCFNVEVRRNHFHSLVDEYWIALQQHISEAGMNPDYFCTREQFKQELNDQSFLGLGIGIFMISFFDTKVLDIQVLYSGDLPKSFYEASSQFKELANDLVEDYISWGFL